MSQKYAAYDATGAITGFYADDISPVPVGKNVIAITDEQWQAAVGAPFDAFTVRVGKLVAPPEPTDAELLATAKTSQVHKLTAACKTAILGGFTYGGYTYPSAPTDQQNLADAMNASLRPDLAANWVTSLWRQDSAGAWAFADHSATEVHQVHGAWIAFRLGQQQQLVSKRHAVNTATTAAAVQAVSW